MPATPYALYDLHLHTGYSYDAHAEIEPYFSVAKQLGVKCIAITEHHNIDSADLVQIAAAKYPEVRLIVAAELTANTSIGPVDLLCYNLPLNPTGKLKKVMAEYHEWQRQTGAAMVNGMQKLGYNYTAQDHFNLLQSYRPKRAMDIQGATHVKNGLQTEYFVKRGFISSADQRAQLNQRLNEAIHFPPYPAVDGVTSAVKEVGGVVVLAHPTLYIKGPNQAKLEALHAECKLDGIECAHPSVPPELTVFYRDYCVRNKMVSTGGSDTHDTPILSSNQGDSSEPIRFANHIGQPQWLDELLERF